MAAALLLESVLSATLVSSCQDECLPQSDRLAICYFIKPAYECSMGTHLLNTPAHFPACLPELFLLRYLNLALCVSLF